MPRPRALAIAALCAAVPVAATPLPDLAPLAAGRTPDAPRMAGLAVATADAGGLQARAWGAAQLAPDGATLAPMRPETLARVASVSKLVTALVALRLAEMGRLDLDRDVRAYGLNLRNPLAPDAPVTVRMLLSHRAGLSDGDRFTVPLGGATLDILQPGGARFTAPPGLRFEYSNAGYGLAAAVLERAGQDRFDRLATRLVLAPLRLDAGFGFSGVSPAARARAATLYRRRDAAGAWGPTWTPQADAPGTPARTGACFAITDPGAPCDLAGYTPGANGFLFSPQGGLRVSAPDLARLGRALLRPRRANQAPGPAAFLGPAAHAQLWRTIPTSAGLPASGEYAELMRSYGLGFQCLTGRGAPAADQPLAPRPTAACGHLGDAYGLTAGLWIDPARDRAFAYIVTGIAADPAAYPGRASRFQAWEETLIVALSAHP